MAPPIRPSTVPAILALLALAVVALPTTVATPASATPTPVGGAPEFAAPGFPGAPLGDRAWNTTAVAAPTPAASTPTSAVFASPPPSVPATTPVVLYLLNASRTTTLKENVSVPEGPWAKIVLNYTGEAVGGVYDSSYTGYLNQSVVLFGTTPEYGAWTVLKDVTLYSSYFRGSVNVTFLMRAAVTTGYFLTSVSLLLYPVPAGAAPPNEPTTILPLWSLVSVSTGSPVVYSDVTVPTDATNATLQIFAYGFGPDEFWYTGEPGYRAIQVYANGTQIATALPFQYINTGGIDLFTWRPITGSFTLDDHPLELNETAALGLLEGPVNLTARISGVTTGSTWIVSGSLLLWTDPAATPSAWVPGAYSFPPVTGSSSTGSHSYSQTERLTYSYASLVGLPGGTENVSLVRNFSYVSNLATGTTWLGASWNNLTATEATGELTTTATPAGAVVEERTWSFPITMHIGDAFVQTSSTNGSYPIFGNFTTYLSGVTASWSGTVDRYAVGGISTYHGSVAEQIAAPTNAFGGTEELTAPNAALILAISTVDSETTKFYTAATDAHGAAYAYAHLLVGAAYQPTDPNQAETVYTNLVTTPLSVGVAASVGIVDVGYDTTLSATVVGGTAPYTVTWSGLPPGCSGVSGTIGVCAPTLPGTYLVSATVRDASGQLGGPATTVVVVNAFPSATLVAERPSVDPGVADNLTLTASGGTAPLRCAWTIGGVPASTPGPCTTRVPILTATPGSYDASVAVTDALGVEVTAALAAPVVVGQPIGVVLLGPTAPVAVATATVVTTTISGGVGTESFTWYENGSVVAGASGPSFTFVPLGPGNYTLAVAVTDSGGGTASASTIEIDVLPPAPASSTGTPAGGTTGISSSDALLYAVIGVAAGLLVGLVIGRSLVARGRPRPPPPRRPPPSRP